MWTRDQKIAFFGAVVTVIGIIVGIYQKEIRIWLGADPRPTSTPIINAPSPIVNVPTPTNHTESPLPAKEVSVTRPTSEPTSNPASALEIIKIDDENWKIYLPAGEWADTGIDLGYGQNISINAGLNPEGFHRFIAKVGNRELESACRSEAPFGHFDELRICVGELDWKSNGLFRPYGVALSGEKEKQRVYLSTNFQPGLNLKILARSCHGWEDCNVRGRVALKNGVVELINHP